MVKNSNLMAAKKAKNDEFYTQLTDIEKELVYYHDQLRGKIIFCNCDDPELSNFWRYFDLNFDYIGIKALIATYYDSEKPTYKLEIRRDSITGHKCVPVRTKLWQNGDFRSDECVALLKQCDVVVTNPPFSLAREFIALLMQYQKKFVIIGNMNLITCKDVFPLIRDNLMWYGSSISGGGRKFRVPDTYPLQADWTGVDADGNKYIRVKGVRWFTNLDHKKRHEPLTLFRRYADDPSMYPKYDEYDVIDVGKTVDIPVDYFGVMGVPISFLDKYCSEQFEILDLVTPLLAGRRKYKRFLIRRIGSSLG